MSTSELHWFKSSYSSAQSDSCVEVAVTEQAIHVRNSKDVKRPRLAVDRNGWVWFVTFAAEV